MDNRHLPIMGDLQGDSFNDLFNMIYQDIQAGKFGESLWNWSLDHFWGNPLIDEMGAFKRGHQNSGGHDKKMTPQKIDYLKLKKQEQTAPIYGTNWFRGILRGNQLILMPYT